MLERLARGQAVERPVAEGHPRHVAHDRRDGGRLLHMQGGFEGVVDANDPIPVLLHADGERAEADRSVEDAGAARKAFDLVDDPRQPVRVKRSEHFGLRAPFVSGHDLESGQQTADSGRNCLCLLSVVRRLLSEPGIYLNLLV